ncbi:MAG: PilZ domain-containing protein [Proteobacteria bacterium]|nr:PilZ domain-containing protein [Pseudomonadota bacterium]MBU4449368.1 PilZ domain-containing protein [Pseudomonadota bacterium]
MTSPLERRRFNRITVTLPVAFHTRLPDTDAPFQGEGVLRDISLGGTYLHVDPGTSFQPGQILSLTVSAPLLYLEDTDLSHLQATGEVIRFDPPTPNRPQAGVALNFLGGLTFCNAPTQQMF